MSRTRRGSKPDGFEYWSARPFAGARPGKKVKKMTHKIERQRNKPKPSDINGDTA